MRFQLTVEFDSKADYDKGNEVRVACERAVLEAVKDAPNVRVVSSAVLEQTGYKGRT